MNTNRIKVIIGDITKIKVDAMVNAANSSLLGGGGVDGAIHRVAGPTLLEECRQIAAKIGRCETGNAVITNAGNLPSKYVIHTVGPVWHGGKNYEDRKLADCYRHSLEIAAKYNCHTIAFPNISTGVYLFPKERAAKISIKAILDFIKTSPIPVEIVLVCFDRNNYDYVCKAISESD